MFNDEKRNSIQETIKIKASKLVTDQKVVMCVIYQTVAIASTRNSQLAFIHNTRNKKLVKSVKNPYLPRAAFICSIFFLGTA